MLSVSAAAAAGLTQFKLGYKLFVVLKACLRPAPSQSLWEMQILTLLLPDPLNQHLWGGSRLLYFHQPFRVFCTWTFDYLSLSFLGNSFKLTEKLQKQYKSFLYPLSSESLVFIISLHLLLFSNPLPPANLSFSFPHSPSLSPSLSLLSVDHLRLGCIFSYITTRSYQI